VGRHVRLVAVIAATYTSSLVTLALTRLFFQASPAQEFLVGVVGGLLTGLLLAWRLRVSEFFRQRRSGRAAIANAVVLLIFAGSVWALMSWESELWPLPAVAVAWPIFLILELWISEAGWRSEPGGEAAL
jgi:hypothetical protein